MKHLIGAVLAVALFALYTPTVHAQDAPTGSISIYRAAPGQQAALLAWLAEANAIAEEAGVPASQFFIHQNGDSWDFLVVSPSSTPEQDEAAAALAEERGQPSGAAAWLEIREMSAEHTDTEVIGPLGAAEIMEMMGGE